MKNKSILEHIKKMGIENEKKVEGCSVVSKYFI